MMSKKLYNVNLQQVHHQSDVHLLDDIDNLRSHGISHLVALPQLVVCGDQSSGKSSVLEAISGIPFPTKDNLCTRFATEVILRRTVTEQVEITISPGPNRNESEVASLKGFQESLTDLDRFAEVFDRAKVFMGLSESGNAFSDDILRIDISGPDRPHLTIVDLPGLIHSHNKSQSADDVEAVQRLVRRYMNSSRSIILAIVSAKNDYANQIVLKMAREVDPQGRRTLGIITKPDMLPAGSESEMAFFNLARNQDVSFQLGWHMLKNRDYESRNCSLAQRDLDEVDFLSQGIWKELPRTEVTVATLRPRLSKVLLSQIKCELPAMINEIEQRLETCRTELRRLGPRRQTNEEQRRFLLHLAQDFQNLARAAIDGFYEGDFFVDSRSELGYSRRVRAQVQNSSLDFAATMRRRGHRYHIGQENFMDFNTTGPKPELMSRDEYLEHAKVLLTRNRGRELPGTFNPFLIAELFHEQSSPWRDLAREYLKTVFEVARKFLESTITYLTQEETAESIMRKVIDPAMEQRRNDVFKSMNSIIDQHQAGHPITYNHYFTETVQEVRIKRMEDDLRQNISKFFGAKPEVASEMVQYNKFAVSKLVSALSTRDEADMDSYACAEAVDCMLAFYKVTMKTVVDNIAIQCIENQLINLLPHMFSTATVVEMDSILVSRLAEESSANSERRNNLAREAEMLEIGLDTCQRHAISQASRLKNGSRDFVGAAVVDREIDAHNGGEMTNERNGHTPSISAKKSAPISPLKETAPPNPFKKTETPDFVDDWPMSTKTTRKPFPVIK